MRVWCGDDSVDIRVYNNYFNYHLTSETEISKVLWTFHLGVFMWGIFFPFNLLAMYNYLSPQSLPAKKMPILKCTSKFSSFLILLWFKSVSVQFISDIYYLPVLMWELFIHSVLVGWSQRVRNMLYNFVTLQFWAAEGFPTWLGGLCSYLVQNIIVSFFLTYSVIVVFPLFSSQASIRYCLVF